MTGQRNNAFSRSKNSFKASLVSDQSIEVINAFGLRNEEHAEGSRVYGIPHPAIFVIDNEGVVRAKFYEEDFDTNKKSYRNRPAVDVVLEGADEVLKG